MFKGNDEREPNAYYQNKYIFLVEAICMCVYTVKLPTDTLPPWRQFGWRQCDLRPNFMFMKGLKTNANFSILGPKNVEKRLKIFF